MAMAGDACRFSCFHPARPIPSPLSYLSPSVCYGFLICTAVVPHTNERPALMFLLFCVWHKCTVRTSHWHLLSAAVYRGTPGGTEVLRFVRLVM